MKENINQLKKEIEELRKKKHSAFLEIKKKSKGLFPKDTFEDHCKYDDLKLEFYEAKAKLQTLQEVYEEIKRLEKKYQDKWKNTKVDKNNVNALELLQRQWKELLKKFQGEEND